MSCPCTVCVHPEREEIDRRLAAGEGSFAGIARQYKLGKDAVRRHAGRHLAYLLAPGPNGELADVSGLRSITVSVRRYRPVSNG